MRHQSPVTSHQSDALARWRAGFTLVEVMLAVAIMLVTGLVIFATTIAGHRALAVNQASVLATQQARQALDMMVRELIRAPTSEITNGDGSDAWPPDAPWSSIRFRYPEQVDSDGVVSDWSDYIAYAVSGGQLVKLQGSLPGGGAWLPNGDTEIAMAFRTSSGTWAGSSGYLVLALTASEATAEFTASDPGDLPTYVDDSDGIYEVLAGTDDSGTAPSEVLALRCEQGEADEEGRLTIVIEARQVGYAAGSAQRYTKIYVLDTTFSARN